MFILSGFLMFITIQIHQAKSPISTHSFPCLDSAAARLVFSLIYRNQILPISSCFFPS
ncbi:hypothetical protein M758_12G087600 [Ceratodon purpureus]|uniref:Uncharacterized protein n=1 Tax=Ceratodon purpureus TaxID=3225 RepID=A0A8T0G691_CERPU|nr:hypothetical protein KC19_12G085400 [Ceratodon purpureus]KAG0598611.1 hypothetical protein M758_12G087600 [Ceratodon purpureus]